MAIMHRLLEKDLLDWKDSEIRYPLILRGARQVGKTYLIEKFGKNHFSSFSSVNFESQPKAIACFESLDPEEILIKLQSINEELLGLFYFVDIRTSLLCSNTAFYRWKQLLGPMLKSRKMENQEIEAKIKCQILNQMRLAS